MLLIQNGTLYTMEDNQVFTGDILIDGKIIAKIAPDIPVENEDWEVINADGKLVFPGFIDAHCHLGMQEEAIGFEGNDVNEMTDPITPQLRAIDGFNPMDISLREAYEHGVTTVATGPGSANVIGGQFAAIKTYGHRVDSMVVKEPLAMKCAFGENPKRVYNSKQKAPTTRMATAALLRETLFKADEYRNQMENMEHAEPSIKSDFKLDALLPVLRREIPLKAHAHRADDIFTALRIAKEFGIRITDHPVIPCQHLSLCAALAFKAGLPKMEALKAITINAAQILDLDEEIGSLKEGKDADLVIYDGDPMEDIEAHPVCTVINGSVVFRMEE